MISKENMSSLIGRKKEQQIILASIALSRHLILEGPVGVGKTFLAQKTAAMSNKHLIRIDGSPLLSSQKLIGHFDPPMVMEHGYDKIYFLQGPLLRAMEEGCILFVNEINRLSIGIQNTLLGVLDEKMLFVPKLGTIKAKAGFCVIATQNPQALVGTKKLSEALLDRCERLTIDYQSFEEEMAILNSLHAKEDIRKKALLLIRATRNHPNIHRGASIRAAQALLSIYQKIPDFSLCAQLALSTRIEWKQEGPKALETLIAELEKKNR